MEPCPFPKTIPITVPNPEIGIHACLFPMYWATQKLVVSLGTKGRYHSFSMYVHLYSKTEIYTYYFVLHYTNTEVCWIVIRKLKYGLDLDVLLCLY